MRSLILTMSALALVLVGFPAPAEASVLDDGITFPQDPAVTSFSNSWGARRSGGRRHKGTDLLAPKLSPVYAVADGIVVRMHHSRLGGHGIEIDHGGGVSSIYIHLNNDTPGTDDGRGYPDWTYAPGLEIGDTVTQGQFIGFVGDSGNAERTASHTHFELRVDGRAQNPYPYLKPVYDQALEASDAPESTITRMPAAARVAAGRTRAPADRPATAMRID